MNKTGPKQNRVVGHWDWNRPPDRVRILTPGRYTAEEEGPAGQAAGPSCLYWTVSETEAEWERFPEVPVIITVVIPRCVPVPVPPPL
jgi:hypothetical protein